MNPNFETYKTKLQNEEKKLLNDFFTFLRFKSISAKESFKPEILKCAHWVSDYLSEIGFKTELWDTSGPPTVFAENLEAGPDKPTLLLYQHYDVQPVDPEDLWDTPPFEPTMRNDHIYARGACDNKGQAFFVFTALRLLFEKEGKYPINIKLLIEGEEETGSHGLASILDQYKDRLNVDYLTIIDVDIPAENTPAITLGGRGILTYTLTFSGSNTDLHSGIHGGLVYNPLRALSESLAAIVDKEGKVTIPNFYKDVKELSKEDKKTLYLDFDNEAYEKEYETKTTGGELNYSPLERTGLRPTFEINGIWGGYNEEGFKTVIPAKAFAKVSMRLVPNQDPSKVSCDFIEYLKSLVPGGINLDVAIEGDLSPAFTCPIQSKIANAASQAYEVVFNKPCQKVVGGGSLPIAALLQTATNAESIAFGMGLSQDKIHAPNENFSFSRLKKGALVVLEFINNLAKS
ncbi:MAG: Succinyl-diaminopimelate desuccinylase [Chlamydiae bacterium]|nr:Succinyl-diaminopimelate desuccinylase [Chlamydiota bacterium]